MNHEKSDAIRLATELTIAWLGNANVRVEADAVPAFLQTMHDTVRGLGDGRRASEATDPVEYTPAVSVRKSLSSPDHIVSMIDGKSYKALKRHLTSNGLTPAEYRTRYGLKADYPMVAPSYSESRSATAKRIGLGRKPKADGATATAASRKTRTKATSVTSADTAE